MPMARTTSALRIAASACWVAEIWARLAVRCRFPRQDVVGDRQHQQNDGRAKGQHPEHGMQHPDQHHEDGHPRRIEEYRQTLGRDEGLNLVQVPQGLGAGIVPEKAGTDAIGEIHRPQAVI